MSAKTKLISILLAVLLSASCIVCGASSAESLRVRGYELAGFDGFPEDNAGENIGYVYSGNFVPQSDYASSLNLLRVIKNRYYNALDGALGEDRTIAHLLYRLFDFVYGDSILDLFADSFAEDEEFIASLASMGYTDAAITRTADSVTAQVSFFGTLRTLTAYYDGENDCARLCIYEDGEMISCMEWRAVAEGYAVQYMRSISPEEFIALYGTPSSSVNDVEPDEDRDVLPFENSFVKTVPGPDSSEGDDDSEQGDTEADAIAEQQAAEQAANVAKLCSYIGYRAYLRDDGTGVVCHGPFSSTREASLLAMHNITVGMTRSLMFCSDIYSLDDTLFTFSGRSGAVVHELGAIYVPEPVQQDEVEGGEPVVNDEP